MSAESTPLRVTLDHHDAALAALSEGRIGDACQQARRAVETAQTVFEANSPDLANIVLTAAEAEEAAGNFTRALELAEHAAEIAMPLSDTDDPELLSLWTDIEVVCARLLSTRGAFAQAESRLQHALGIACQLLAATEHCVLAIHNMRGVTAKYAGRFDDAACHYDQMRAVLDVEPVADRDSLAGLLHNLGGLAHAQGHVSEGLAHAERGLRLRIEAVGDVHPDVARDLNALGALHHDSGDSAAATAAYRRALHIFEQTLGADHYEVAMTLANLAVTEALVGENVASRRLYERALGMLESILGPAHPDVALVQHNLAALLGELGDLAGAFDLLIQAEAGFASLAPDHPRRRDLQATVARLSSHR